MGVTKRSIKARYTLKFSANANIAAATTAYLACVETWYGTSSGSLNETGQEQRFLVVRAGVVKNLVCYAEAAPGAGETFVYTVRKNGADQTLTVTLAGATAQLDKDTTHSFSVAIGDYITLKIVNSAGGASTQHQCSMDLS